MVYDSFLLGALTMAYGAMVTLLLYVFQGDTSGGEYRPMIATDWGNIAFLAGLFISLSGFYVFFWMRAGQTAGMRAWRLKVVSCSNTGSNPRFKQSVIRTLIAPLSLLVFGLGYWWRWLDKGGDCLHDRISGTRVIVTPPRKRRKVTESA